MPVAHRAVADAEVGPGNGKTGLQLDRLGEILDGTLILAELVEGDAAIDIGGDQFRAILSATS